MNTGNNEVVNKDNDTKKIFSMLVLIFTLMICTTSATYAYFAINATAVNNITGVVASGNIEFSQLPTLVSPSSSTYNTLPMVPQYAYNKSKNVLQLAITGGKPNGGTTAVPCVDGNGNVICRVYSFTIRNNSSAVVNISGTINFTNPTTNLRWAPMSNATTVVNITSVNDTDIHTASTSAATFYGGDGTTSIYQLAANGGTKQFWVVFWINETGAVQTDSGTWYATLTFNEANGKGITSTIVG